ncbi:MAG: hypothetical protein V1922_05795 [bacterium]
MNISACVVSNEEIRPYFIAHLLELCNEVVINFNNTTLSNDYKKSILTTWGKKVVILENKFTDWAHIRNATIEASSSEWCITVDNGELLTPLLIQEIKALPDTFLYDIVQFQRIHFVIDPPVLVDHFYHKRLFKRHLRYHGVLYEHLVNYKSIFTIDKPYCYLLHLNTRAEEIKKTLKRKEYLLKQINEYKKSGNETMVSYYKYFLWVLDEVFMKEFGPRSNAIDLEKIYKTYDLKTAQFQKLINQVENA